MVASVTAALRCRYVVFYLPMFKKIIKNLSCFVDFAHTTHNKPTAPNIVERSKFETIVIAL